MTVAKSTERLAQLGQLIEGVQGFAHVATATTSSRAQMLAVKGSVDFAVIEADVTRCSEFPALTTCFQKRQIRWCVIADRDEIPALRDRFSVFGVAVFARGVTPDALAASIAPMGRRPAHKAPNGASHKSKRLILLGSSTGGVEALIDVLSHFPDDCPPTFLVQHTGGQFSQGLARVLDARIAPKLLEAEDGMVVPDGTICLAPGDKCHLTIDPGNDRMCRLIDAPPEAGHRPSVDALFRSGVPFASKVTAAILTGMGRDGALGLRALRDAGARTIGQDEATSLVYGMPKAAFELGGVAHQLPLSEIGPALTSNMGVAP